MQIWAPGVSRAFRGYTGDVTAAFALDLLSTVTSTLTLNSYQPLLAMLYTLQTVNFVDLC